MECEFQGAKTIPNTDLSHLTPGQAKRKGKTLKLRKDWELVKDLVMFELVLKKFKDNEGLGQALLETGDELIEEGNTWGDTYWGTVNGEGKNKLGKILMAVRGLLNLDLELKGLGSDL